LIWNVDAMHRTVEERRDHGKELRGVAPREAHSIWSPPADRPDPVSLITGQDESRIQRLVPVRHWRMSQSAFSFYRGAALVMASDLASTPSTGIEVQLCGDAHLSNFGMFASAERTLIFDVNDFDETIPGPWEWDVKRLVASFAIAGRFLNHDAATTRKTTRRVGEAYREAMLDFAGQKTMDVWYAKSDFHDVLEDMEDEGKKKRLKRGRKVARKALSHNSLKALSKLAYTVDGRYRIKSDPPVLVPLRDLDNDEPEVLEEMVRETFESYRTSLRPDRRVLLDKFTPIDVALKVVGVGSVGNRSFVLLLMGRDDQDPLFLQIKQAQRSVLEPYLSPSPFENQGARVVHGQRLMQASSDIFLGWSEPIDGHDYYWRQLRDWKYSFDVAHFNEKELYRYARSCGNALARSHARSGDPIAISSYLGKSDTFDEALAEFADAYADQNQQDYQDFTAAIERGDIEAAEG
jgi:uncharacterized protein (DUF2252 family)